MNLTELTRVIESVGRDRGIKKEIIVAALEQAILAAAQKKYGTEAVMEAHYNDESGDIDLFLFKKVVDSDDDMLEPTEEIKIEEARELDPDAQIGDEIGIKVETPTFGRIDAQMAKQVIFQKVRDAERDIIYNEYIHQKGEIVSGIARRVERGNLVVDLGRTDALLPRGEIIPGEQYKPGDRVQAFLVDVVLSTRGPQIYLSRTSARYLMKLFEQEVPEIRDGIVEIRAVAREPGVRSKIAVTSKDRDIDPVGACVGMKGMRVQQVIGELKGEKIDIIPYSENHLSLVKAALQPAEVSQIRVDERNKAMEVIVEDSQLSLAIGRKGQNVRLAAQLCGWKLDILSRTKLQQRTQNAVFNLGHIEGVNETLAQALLNAGLLSVRQVAEATVETLSKVPGFESPEAALNLKTRAQELVEKAGDLLAGSADGASSFSTDSNKDAKANAEERLKKMMQEAAAKPEGE